MDDPQRVGHELVNRTQAHRLPLSSKDNAAGLLRSDFHSKEPDEGVVGFGGFDHASIADPGLGKQKANLFMYLSQGCLFGALIALPSSTGKVPHPRERDCWDIVTEQAHDSVPAEQRDLGTVEGLSPR